MKARPATLKAKADSAGVSCVGCGAAIEISTAPVRLREGFACEIFQACARAPHICPICRLEPKRLEAARAEMEKHFAECRRG